MWGGWICSLVMLLGWEKASTHKAEGDWWVDAERDRKQCLAREEEEERRDEDEGGVSGARRKLMGKGKTGRAGEGRERGL